MQHIRMPQLTPQTGFEYKIWYHVALREKTVFYETQDFTFIDVLLKNSCRPENMRIVK